MSDEVVYGVILICGTGLFGWCLVSGFRSGTMVWGYFGLHVSGHRKTEPGKFWAATLLLAIPFALGLIALIAMILWPHGIGR